MKSKILLILFSLISLVGFAQEDHLEPVEGYFDMQDYRFEYYAKIRSFLFKGMPDYPVLRYLVKPSFDAEYVLQIDRDNANKKYYINVRKAKENIWYAKNKPNVDVEKWRNAISEEDVELISQLYRNALLKTQYVVRNTMGLDGTTYIFTLNEMGLMSGQTWSPAKNSNMGKLIQISDKLIEEVQSSTFVGISPALRSQIKELSNVFFL